MNIRKIAPALMAAGLVVSAAITGSTVAGASTTTTHPPLCYVNGVLTPFTRHVIPAGRSLDRWVNQHATYAAHVISDTAECGPGLQWTMLHYVNAGNWHRRFTEAVTVWTFPWAP